MSDEREDVGEEEFCHEKDEGSEGVTEGGLEKLGASGMTETLEVLDGFKDKEEDAA